MSFSILSFFVLNACTHPAPVGFNKAELRKTDDSTKLQFNAVLLLKSGGSISSIEPTQLKVYFDDKYLGTAFLIADTQGESEDVFDLPFRIVFNSAGFALKKPQNVKIQGELNYNNGKSIAIDYGASVNILNLTLR